MDMMLSYNGTLLSGDMAVCDVDIATDEGLQTAVVISLFTDRLAEDDDELPAGAADRRGWWGDLLTEVEEDRIGSRLWLLSREKELPEILVRAEEYAAEALRWLLDDKIAQRVDVSASSPKRGWLVLSVGIARADGTRFEQEFPYNYGEAA